MIVGMETKSLGNSALKSRLDCLCVCVIEIQRRSCVAGTTSTFYETFCQYSQLSERFSPSLCLSVPCFAVRSLSPDHKALDDDSSTSLKESISAFVATSKKLVEEDESWETSDSVLEFYQHLFDGLNDLARLNNLARRDSFHFVFPWILDFGVVSWFVGICTGANDIYLIQRILSG